MCEKPTPPWVCCHCDADLCCAACGMEQPNDQEHYRRQEAELFRLRAQIDGTKAGRDFHIDTASELFAVLTAILEAENEFRQSMGEHWEGDPLSDACDAAREFINLGAPARPEAAERKQLIKSHRPEGA